MHADALADTDLLIISKLLEYADARTTARRCVNLCSTTLAIDEHVAAVIPGDLNPPLA